jgi:hypothetical protein
VPKLVNRQFYDAAHASLVPSLTLVLDGVWNPQCWLDSVSVPPAGQIRHLVVSERNWNRLDDLIQRPGSRYRQIFDYSFCQLETFYLRGYFYDNLSDSPIKCAVAARYFLTAFGAAVWRARYRLQEDASTTRASELDGCKVNGPCWTPLTSADGVERIGVGETKTLTEILPDPISLIHRRANPEIFLRTSVVWDFRDVQVEIEIFPETRNMLVLVNTTTLRHRLRQIRDRAEFHLPSSVGEYLMLDIEWMLLKYFHQIGLLMKLPQNILPRGGSLHPYYRESIGERDVESPNAME